MKRRRALVSSMIVVVLSLFARPADAGILRWLDRLSGPGPFWGVDVSYALRCFAKSEPPADGRNRQAADEEKLAVGFVLGCPSRIALDRRYLAWNATVGGAIASSNNLQYDDANDDRSRRIALMKVGSSLDYTLLPALDVGFGGGFMYFAGPRFDNFALPYVEPVRVTIRPLLPFTRRHALTPALVDRRGWLLFSVSWNILVGTVDGAKFGAPSDPFHAHTELTRVDYGVSVDLGRLLRSHGPRADPAAGH